MPQAPVSSETLSAFRAELSDRYHLEHELGRGGMATVYLAHELASDRLVALKVLNPELGASLGAERFLREIEVGKQLQHPNIVGVLDSGSADGKLFYTMPYIDGASLRDRLDREKQLSIEETMSLAGEIADALDYAHARGIVHRDIKPENILLHDGRAMVADFGIARAVTLAGGSSLTSTGSSIGTPTYMSPEQPLGSKDVTPESDIYSLGCVVYELLIGEPPFSGPNALALLARHSLERVPSLKIVRVSIPDAVEDAVMKAMAKVPADRFRTASAFARALSDDAGAARRRVLHSRRPRWKLLVAGIALPVVAASAWLLRDMSSARSPAAAVASPVASNGVAVLYFDDQSPGHSLQYLADGLTELLIQQLGTVKGLNVTSPNGVRPLKGKVVRTDSIAKMLGVGVVVRGRVSEAGDALRVMVQVLDVKTGRTLASPTIEASKQNAVALQRGLAHEVSTELREVLGERVPVFTSGSRTWNSAAWEGYLRARQTVTLGDSLISVGDAGKAMATLERAESEFAKVASQDRGWSAPAAQQAILAYRVALLGVRAAAPFPSVNVKISTGLAVAEGALRTSPNDADALEARGALRYLQSLLGLVAAKDQKTAVAAAEADLTAAIAANPAQASAMNTLSHLYKWTGRAEMATRMAGDAYRADPYQEGANKTVWRLFQTSLDLDFAQDAIQWCNEGARRFPQDSRFVECRLWLLSRQGQNPPPTTREIWQTYYKFLEADQVDRPEYAMRKGQILAGIGLFRAGLKDSANAVVTRGQVNESVDPSGDLVYLEAMARSQFGQKDLAIALLSRYFAAHAQQQPYAERDDSFWWAPLRDDPRYKALFGEH